MFFSQKEQTRDGEGGIWGETRDIHHQVRVQASLLNPQLAARDHLDGQDNP